MIEILQSSIARKLIGLLRVGFALIAVHFGLVMYFGGSPVTPELYGPAVYAMPAVAWAAVQFVAECIICAGLYMGRRIGAIVALIGAFFALPFYMFLGAASTYAGQGVIVTASVLWVMLPSTIFIIFAAWQGAKRV